ncbi:hypothetical protein [Actinomadura bangladeshensis]|uniref:DNA-binding phage zinc finger domain-containing protein n=1 Tax=Actinomadura bangladeshensis TaxID=453573 RepID=A0A6L9QBK7_9ACTN|nr:hypothetical protein [Actinomadura bangladeshensis]NEA22635.1 hypothetical protein [Actinomadura bangladeshensis]
MPNKPRTQHRSVRVDAPEWDDLDAAADEIGLDRAKVINLLIENWLGRPGAEAPPRPSRELMERIIAARHVREAEIPKIAVAIPCPTCKVKQGPCVSNGGRRPTDDFHRARLDAAGKELTRRQKAEGSSRNG